MDGNGTGRSAAQTAVIPPIAPHSSSRQPSYIPTIRIEPQSPPRSSLDQQRSGHPSLIHSGDHLLLSYLSLRGRGRPSWTAPLRGGVPAMKPHGMSADPMPWVAIPVATWSQGRSGQHYLSMMRSPSHLSLLSGVCWGLKICLLEAVPAITVPDALPRSRYSFCGPRSPMQWFQIFGK